MSAPAIGGAAGRGAAAPQTSGWTADFAIVRTPLFPYCDLAAMAEGLRVPDIAVPDIAVPGISGAADLETAVAADRALLRARLSAFFGHPEAREALFVASPSLEADLGVWREHPDSERGAKVERALVRYLVRMTARGTPFGLLAGWSLAEVGLRTRLDLAGREQTRRWSRVDLHVLAGLAERAIADEAVRATLRVRPNPTLRSLGRALRYVEPREDAAGRHLFLSSVERTPWLDAALEQSRAGALVADLAVSLSEAYGVGQPEALDFIQALIRGRVLMPDIEIRVTGEPPHRPFAGDLRRSRATAPWADVLDEVAASLGSLDAGGLGHAPQRYREALRPLASLPVDLDTGLLVHVDIARPGRLVLGDAVVAELARAIDALCRLVPEREPEDLRAFREAFIRRYGDGEVPLLDVLDEDGGIGFGGSAAQERAPSALLDGIPFPAPSPMEPLAWGGAASRLILAKYADALSSGRREVEFRTEEVGALPAAGDPAPEALAAFATLVARDPERVDDDFLLFLRAARGPPAGALLGRFCHQDPALEARVRDLARAEAGQHPGAVLAEVVHLPEGRVGNVVCRPILREAEIPWLSSPGVDAAHSYPPADLLVSVRGGRLRLRSRRSGQEVIPRLSSAHGYEHGIGLYRFLGTLQSQGRRASVHFSWGALADAPFLPRVRIGRVVVFPASWRLWPAEIAAVSGVRGAALVRAARALRQARQLPRRFAAGEGDNEMVVDLDDVLSLESFAHFLRGRETVRVAEIPYDLAPGAVRGPDGWYANELVVPMLRRPAAISSSTDSPVPLSGPVSGTGRPTPVSGTGRRYPPGSEWLYARLYCGPAGADEVLLGVAARLARHLIGSGAADRWYFVRYGDPDWHLRLRFHGDPTRLQREGLPALHAAVAPLLDDRLVERMTLDTHEPEAERYGGEAALPLAEAWFQADSQAALATMAALAEEGRDEDRGLAALESVARTWIEMGFEGDALRDALVRARDAFRGELGAGTPLLRAAGARYREVEGRLRELLPTEGSSLLPPAPGSPLAVRASATRALADDYRRLAAAGALSVPLAEVTWSLAHLAANRLVAAAARRHELVIHELACRYLESLRHRH